ncbi:MAG: undecaprenyl-diphosphate phosphatase [Acidobacteriaceae bacterium]|nr:undecaprenyl-diphosphate phosphatase [Acidobacteriaceae bacterium]
MAPLQAALLGVVQGLTEFLPVSSTAHLLVSERLLGYDDPGSVFTEMIQLGSMFAILWLYREKIIAVVRGLPSDRAARHFALMLFVAFVPAIVAGLLLSGWVERVLHKSIPVMATAFIVGGVVMLLVERFRPTPTVTRVDDTSIPHAAGIGLAQVLALVPGVSRSGATIVGGLLMRLERPAAAEFSFFLAMPTLAAAFAHSAIELRHQMTPDRFADIAIGFVTAFVASVIVVRPFLSFVRRSGFRLFAWYRIVAGALLLAGVAAGYL